MSTPNTAHVPNEIATAAWTQREYGRILGGTYKTLVWENESFWRNRSFAMCEHFAHVSPANPALLAYTQDDEKGCRDIQTPIKPGRYLTRYFSDVLTEKEIAALAAWQISGERVSKYTGEAAFPLCLAAEADEIARVYICGPQSCMKDFDLDTHPTRVYAAGDLAVAYLAPYGVAYGEDDFKPVARALVWPERKVCSRIYPTTEAYWRNDGFESQSDAQSAYDALESRLRAAGYTFDLEHDAFNGAKLETIEGRHGGYVMPYLDHGYMVGGYEGAFTMQKHGEWEADNTDGTLPYEDESYGTCERCDNTIRTEEDAHSVYTIVRNGQPRNIETWCEYCADNRAFWCYGTEGLISDDNDSSEVPGLGLVSLSYAENNFTYSDRSEEWFDGESVKMENGETWSLAEFHLDGFTCLVSGEKHDSDEMHVKHENVYEYVTEEALAEWLATQESENQEQAA